MTTQPNPVTPLRSPEQLVGELVDLQDQVAALDERMKAIRSQLVEHIGVGNNLDVNGVKVSVREPSRRFNLARAQELVTPEVLELAKEVSPAALKKFLSPILLDQCMEPSNGAPVVTVR